MKKTLSLIFIFTVILSLPSCFLFKPVQKTCPATGRKIKNMTGKKAKIVQVNGEDIALCCGGCYKKTTKMAEKKRMNYLFSDKSFKKGYVLASSQK